VRLLLLLLLLLLAAWSRVLPGRQGREGEGGRVGDMLLLLLQLKVGGCCRMSTKRSVWCKAHGGL